MGTRKERIAKTKSNLTRCTKIRCKRTWKNIDVLVERNKTFLYTYGIFLKLKGPLGSETEKEWLLWKFSRRILIHSNFSKAATDRILNLHSYIFIVYWRAVQKFENLSQNSSHMWIKDRQLIVWPFDVLFSKYFMANLEKCSEYFCLMKFYIKNVQFWWNFVEMFTIWSRILFMITCLLHFSKNYSGWYLKVEQIGSTLVFCLSFVLKGL